MPERIALIADEDTVLGFGALGMDCRVAENSRDSADAFAEMLRASYAVIFITDEVAAFLEQEVPGYMQKGLIVTIPSCRSRNKMGLKELTAIVEKAVGISNIMDKA